VASGVAALAAGERLARNGEFNDWGKIGQLPDWPVAHAASCHRLLTNRIFIAVLVSGHKSE